MLKETTPPGRKEYQQEGNGAYSWCRMIKRGSAEDGIETGQDDGRGTCGAGTVRHPVLQWHGTVKGSGINDG